MDTAQETESRQDLADVDPLARPRVVSDELRASLEAVRTAQAAARGRARRETRRARVVALGVLVTVGGTAWAATHRPPKTRALATGPTVASPSVATPPTAPSLALPPIEAPPAVQPAQTDRSATSERLAVSARPVPGASGSQVALCDAAFAQRSWTTVASTCAAAFDAQARDSALAMRVAQAEHRRGHIATAATWAHKALAVDADIPEAFAIIAHAEAGAGHARRAAEAYRHYLTLAPRGWHAPETRRALRAAPRASASEDDRSTLSVAQ